MSDPNPYEAPRAAEPNGAKRSSRLWHTIGWAGVCLAVVFWGVALRPDSPHTLAQQWGHAVALVVAALLAVVFGGIGAITTRRTVYGYAALAGILELMILWVATQVA